MSSGERARISFMFSSVYYIIYTQLFYSMVMGGGVDYGSGNYYKSKIKI